MEPEVPKGDFNDRPPHPEQLENVRPARGNGFHPDKSQVVDEENTETKKVYRNADGTTTEAISLRPSRYRAEGGWRDIDFGLVPGPEATLQARSAPRPVRLAGKADGPSSVDTPSGPIVLRHRGASSTAAVVDGATATYPGALGGRDLKMVLTDEGFKESMIVPNPAAGGSYVDEFTLPQGVTARQGDRGVESVDLAGEVVARFHDGWAFDASPEPRPPAAVSVRLVSEEPTPERSAPAAPTESTPPADAPATSPPDPAPSNRSASPRPSSPPTTSRTAVVEVGVDPAWLADPARVFPVTIDPSVTVGFLRGG